MFAFIEKTLRALPSSIKLNGVTYTDLWYQPDSVLNSIGIYKLPEMPAYDSSEFKLSADYDTKQWQLIPLTPEEKSEILRSNYIREFIKLEGKYKTYLMLYESKKENLYVAAQLEAYLINLIDYMSKIYNQEISLTEIKDYPEPTLSSYSNNL